MKIQHIIWDDSVKFDPKVTGICEIEIYYHGGGSNTILVEGTYEIINGKGKFTNRDLGISVGEDTTGVSDVFLVRVGNIV